MDTKQISDTVNVIYQILTLMLPFAAILVVWFLRTYVRSAKAERTLATIIQISNAAVNFAEDLDQRGELAKYLKIWNVPEDVVNLTSNGLKKLHLAGQWAESEFVRLGIKMTDTDAQAWIAAEYQRRQGGAGPEQPPVDRSDHATSPPITIKPGALTDALPKAEASPAGPPPDISIESELAKLAAEAAQYAAKLKTDQQVAVPESEIAIAYMQIEGAQQRLMATDVQIATAVATALEAKRVGQPTS